MAAIVKREKRTLYMVLPDWRTSCHGPKPITKPEMTAAIKMPVPEADSQLSWKIAASAVGLATTGGTRWIRLCNPLMGTLKIDSLSKKLFTDGSPHRKTSTLRMAQGTHAFTTSRELYPCWPRAVRSASCPCKPQIFLGCQLKSNTMSAAIEHTAAITSTSHGP